VRRSRPNDGRASYPTGGDGKRGRAKRKGGTQLPVFLEFWMAYTEPFHVGFCPVAVGNKSAFLLPLNTMAPTVDQPIHSMNSTGRGDGFHEH
jgi:hypothetical protein